MTTVKAVKEPEVDPKAGKTRQTSGVEFPYWDLESSIEVANVMHTRAGGACDLAQLATMLGYSGVRNGSFRTRVSAAKMFGLIEDTENRRLRVTARGRAILAPVVATDAQRARVEAFLDVDLFSRVYQRFHGTTLPENVGMRHMLQHDYTVVTDRVAPTVRILLDSAEQAGLFAMAGNRTRMVMPTGITPSAATPPSPPQSSHAVPETPRYGGNGGGGSGGGDDTSGIDPAILGLLKRLPPGGTPMTEKRRKALIDAFTNVVGFIYPDDEAHE